VIVARGHVCPDRFGTPLSTLLPLPLRMGHDDLMCFPGQFRDTAMTKL
jgi:hypothetical protein